MTSQERVLATKLQKLILVTMFQARSVESDDEREKCFAVAHLALRKYCSILYFEDDGAPRPIRADRRIASFSASQCWNFFETRQDDLVRLLRALRLLEICTLRNGSAMASEEVMLTGFMNWLLARASSILPRTSLGVSNHSNQEHSTFSSSMYSQHSMILCHPLTCLR